jgi:hypothetical protein
MLFDNISQGNKEYGYGNFMFYCNGEEHRIVVVTFHSTRGEPSVRLYQLHEEVTALVRH